MYTRCDTGEGGIKEVGIPREYDIPLEFGCENKVIFENVMLKDLGAFLINFKSLVSLLETTIVGKEGMTNVYEEVVQNRNYRRRDRTRFSRKEDG